MNVVKQVVKPRKPQFTWRMEKLFVYCCSDTKNYFIYFAAGGNWKLRSAWIYWLHRCAYRAHNMGRMKSNSTSLSLRFYRILPRVILSTLRNRSVTRNDRKCHVMMMMMVHKHTFILSNWESFFFREKKNIYHWLRFQTLLTSVHTRYLVFFWQFTMAAAAATAAAKNKINVWRKTGVFIRVSRTFMDVASEKKKYIFSRFLFSAVK